MRLTTLRQMPQALALHRNLGKAQAALADHEALRREFAAAEIQLLKLEDEAASGALPESAIAAVRRMRMRHNTLAAELEKLP